MLPCFWTLDVHICERSLTGFVSARWIPSWVTNRKHLVAHVCCILYKLTILLYCQFFLLQSSMLFLCFSSRHVSRAFPLVVEFYFSFDLFTFIASDSSLVLTKLQSLDIRMHKAKIWTKVVKSSCCFFSPLDFFTSWITQWLSKPTCVLLQWLCYDVHLQYENK